MAVTAMRPRNPEQDHRTATPLELLFDLVFVVAVSRASLEAGTVRVRGLDEARSPSGVRSR